MNPHQPHFVVALLGGLRLTANGSPVHLPSRSARLLALLALRGPTARALVAGYLWPEAPEDRARASVRTTLRDLQRRAPALLTVSSEELRLSHDVPVDAAELRELAQALIAARPDDATLAAGLELVAGRRLGADLLPGSRDDWVLAEAERLHHLRLHALDALVHRLVFRGQLAQALEIALASIPTDPLRESTHRAVMGVFLAEGNTVDALRQYQKFRTTLMAEMGIEPSQQMLDLVHTITSGGERREPLPAVGRQP